jgi:hypothetical protein
MKVRVLLVGVVVGTAVFMFAPRPWMGPNHFTAWAAGISGIGTVAAVAVAAWGFTKQSELTQRALAQTEEQLQRERDAVLRRQADMVSAWFIGDVGDLIYVRNGSELPVHRLVAFIVDGRAGRIVSVPERGRPDGPMGKPLYFDPVLPAKTVRQPVQYRGGGMSFRPGVQIAFTDTAGNHWVRRPASGSSATGSPCFPRSAASGSCSTSASTRPPAGRRRARSSG